MVKNKIIKKNIIFTVFLAILIVMSITSVVSFDKKDSISTKNTKKMDATIMSLNDNNVTVLSKNNTIYTFNQTEMDVSVGDKVVIEYMGVLDKNKCSQSNKVVSYKVKSVVTDENGIPKDYLDNGIFSDFYILAHNKLKQLSLDEKINQLLLVRYPDSNQRDILKNNQFGGYVFFAKDFKDKTKEEVINMTKQLQEVSKIPILTAVDEEGGNVVRISSNVNLRGEKFKSSRELYTLGGLGKIKEDTIEKSNLLNSLGINLNLAPVVDVSTDPKDYMYSRTLGENTTVTADYAKTVIEASKGKNVSYTLKHFPGYGNNSDTHAGTSVDNRSLEQIRKNDLPPFKTGIENGAEAVLVSHNTVNSIDSNNPASLSPSVHNLLRNELGFTGVVITDDLAMGATSSIKDAAVKAVLAGNDLLITTDYNGSFNSIKDSINNGNISEELIDRLVFRVLAWKYYKGLMFGVNK